MAEEDESSFSFKICVEDCDDGPCDGDLDCEFLDDKETSVI